MKPRPISLDLSDRELSLLFQAAAFSLQGGTLGDGPKGADLVAITKLSRLHDLLDYDEWIERGELATEGNGSGRADEIARTYLLPPTVHSFLGDVLRAAVGWQAEAWVARAIVSLAEKFAVEVPGLEDWTLDAYEVEPAEA